MITNLKKATMHELKLDGYFSSHTANQLAHAGIKNVEELQKVPDFNLMNIRGIGRVSMSEIHSLLDLIQEQEENKDVQLENEVEETEEPKVVIGEYKKTTREEILAQNLERKSNNDYDKTTVMKHEFVSVVPFEYPFNTKENCYINMSMIYKIECKGINVGPYGYIESTTQGNLTIVWDDENSRYFTYNPQTGEVGAKIKECIVHF